MKFSLCLDNKQFTQKPPGSAVAGISKRLPKNEISLTMKDLRNRIEWGYSWCPATFNGNRKRQENFKSQQVFALDFDGGFSLAEALERAKLYDLNVAMSYETFSSNNGERFRLLFLYMEPIKEFLIAKMIQLSLCTIFPEADPSGKDPTKLYYAGHNAILYEEEPFSMEPLIIGLGEHIKITAGEKHYTEKTRRFCKDASLFMRDNDIMYDFSVDGPDTSPAVVTLVKNGDILPYSFIVNRKSDKKSPFMGRIYFCLNRQYLTVNYYKKKASSKRESCKHITSDLLEQKCRLFHEFSNGTKWLDHMELMLIASNLVQVNGGKKQFLEILAAFPEYYESKTRISYYLKHFIKNHYLPFGCDRICPYADICTHHKNIICTVKSDSSLMTRLKGYVPPYISLEDAERDFQENFNRAVEARFSGVTVLKAPTGIGKTTAYIHWLQETDHPHLIALPTNRLKMQVAKIAQALGIPVKITPSVESLKQHPKVGKMIEALYQQGADDQVNLFLRRWNKNQNDPEITAYLKETDKIFKGNCHILTTHARFVRMKPKHLAKYKVIIDEDILPMSLQTMSIALVDIECLLRNCKLPEQMKEQILKIYSRIQEREQYFEFPRICWLNCAWKQLWKSIDESCCVIHSNIKVLLSAEYFYYDRHNECLHLLCEQLPQISEFLVLSATANKALYERIFGKERIRFIECMEAKNLGKMIQHHDQTYSRYCIQKDPDLYNKLHQEYPGLPLITFKGYDPYASIYDLHFGATEGSNQYEGKDIIIVGTPHYPEFIYRLLGRYLQYDMDDHLCFRAIEHNGFRLMFYTYESVALRNLQLWKIESELEQAIGRARLLRNDCAVYLYSNFPVKQTTLLEEVEGKQMLENADNLLTTEL